MQCSGEHISAKKDKCVNTFPSRDATVHLCHTGPPAGQKAALAGTLWEALTIIQPMERSILKSCREIWGRKKSSNLCAYVGEWKINYKLLDCLSNH